MGFFRNNSGNQIFPYFEKQTTCISKAAQLLRELVCTDTLNERKNLYRSIKLVETEGDAVLTALYEEMVETRRVPFKRADIQRLAAKLDDFLDHINDSAKRILIYMPKRMDLQMVELADYILEDANVLADLTNQLNLVDFKPLQVLQRCERITQIEHASDDVFGEYLTFLFENEKDAIELVKYKSLVEALEDTTDLAKDIADLIRKIVITR